MRTTLSHDPYAPIGFSDGRIFEIQDCSAVELSHERRLYRVTLELMERTSQHLHCLEIVIYWGQICDDQRRPSGEMLLHVVRETLTPEIDTWRYPERKSSFGTTHRFEIGGPSEPPI